MMLTKLLRHWQSVFAYPIPIDCSTLSRDVIGFVSVHSEQFLAISATKFVQRHFSLLRGLKHGTEHETVGLSVVSTLACESVSS